MSTAREKAKRDIEMLYGYEDGSVQAVIEEMGAAALSDEALIEIAKRQNEREQKRGAHLERVARYQDTHPGSSWADAETAIRWGIS